MSPAEILNKKRKLIGSVTVAILLMASIFTAFMILPQNTTTVQAADTTDFSHSKGITFDHTQIPSTMTNFPVLIKTTDTDLRDDAQNDGDDIAFFDSSNTTQYAHEIETFNGATGELVAWVNVTSLSSTVDTVIYMYYGNASIANQENVANTWDSNYIHIWHMDGSATEPDSVGSDDGTVTGADVVDGKIGKARRFIQVNEDYIDYGDMAQPADGSLNVATFEVWSYLPPDNGSVILNKYDYDSGAYRYSYYTSILNDGELRVGMFNGASNYWTYTTDNGMPNSTWVYSAITVHASDETASLYMNGSIQSSNKTHDSGTGPGAFIDKIATDTSGRLRTTQGGYSNSTTDELRISKIERSGDWLKTCFNSMNNATSGGFYTISGESTGAVASSFSLSGFDSNSRITWSGEAGDTVWSNKSTYGTLTIQTNINATDNCTAIYIDIADFASVIDADNITAVVKASDGSWAGATPIAIGSSPNYNLTIDENSPSSWFRGTNPFPMDGAAWTNVTLEVRFKCAISSGAGTGTYLNTSASWNVIWKVES